MIWRPVDDQECKRKQCVRMERVTNDVGDVLGSVMQFNGDGIAYAIGRYSRLGPAPTFDRAKEMVERSLQGDRP